jgi:predicted phosphodiesterase
LDSQSPLDAFADQLVRWRMLDMSYTDMAKQISAMGTATTRHSVRRFFDRFTAMGPKPVEYIGTMFEIHDGGLTKEGGDTAMPKPSQNRQTIAGVKRTLDPIPVETIQKTFAQQEAKGQIYEKLGDDRPEYDGSLPLDQTSGFKGSPRVAPDYKAITGHFGVQATPLSSQSATTATNTTATHYTIWADKPLMRDMEIKIPKPPTSQTEWGYGAARPVPLNRRAHPTEVVIFINDVHFPYQDEGLVREALRLIELVEPDRVVLNGDINDFFQLSRFNTSLERLDHLQEEIDMANEFRRDVRFSAPDAVIDETEGNHDQRIRTFVERNAKALHTLDAIKPNKLFLYDELEIKWHPGAGFLLRPHFLVKHGTLLRSECPNTAKAELMAANISGISGHTHRLGTYRRAGYAQRQWTESGGLMRMDPDYVVGVPNWTPGLCIGEFSTSTDTFRIHEVPAVDGKLSLFGEGRYE